MTSQRRNITINDIPDNHTHLQGYHTCENDDGIKFSLSITKGRQRVGSNELVKAQIKSITRGGPISQSDLYKENTRIILQIENFHQLEITANENGTYSNGRMSDQRLNGLITQMIERYAPTKNQKTSGPKI